MLENHPYPTSDFLSKLVQNQKWDMNSYYGEEYLDPWQQIIRELYILKNNKTPIKATYYLKCKKIIPFAPPLI